MVDGKYIPARFVDFNAASSEGSEGSERRMSLSHAKIPFDDRKSKGDPALVGPHMLGSWRSWQHHGRE